MANNIVGVIMGFIGGLGAGIVGYVTDMTLGAVFQAFGTLSSLFIVLGIAYGIISFIIGLTEAYTTGVFFTIGIIAIGWFLGDAVTTVGGLISIAGLIFSLIRRR